MKARKPTKAQRKARKPPPGGYHMPSVAAFFARRGRLVDHLPQYAVSR